MWWSIGGGIIIFALGMFIFLKPGLIWKLTEEWKSYRADEPSEFYLKATKIGGALFALFGIIMIMLPFIWGMAGENLIYNDMQVVKIPTLE